MKKIKILLFLVVAFCNLNVSLADDFRKIPAHCKFGKPRDCSKGLGWCIIKAVPSPGTNIGNGMEMQNVEDGTLDGIFVFNSEGELEIEIDKSSGITKETYDQYLRPGFMIFEEDFSMPKNVLEKMGYPGEFIIRAGKYKAEEKDGKIKLVIAG